MKKKNRKRTYKLEYATDYKSRQNHHKRIQRLPGFWIIRMRRQITLFPLWRTGSPYNQIKQISIEIWLAFQDRTLSLVRQSLRSLCLQIISKFTSFSHAVCSLFVLTLLHSLLVSLSSSIGKLASTFGKFEFFSICKQYQSRFCSSVSRMSWASGATKSAHDSHNGCTIKSMKPTFESKSLGVDQVLLPACTSSRLTWDFSIFALRLSHIALISKPSLYSRSPCKKNSLITRSVHCLYKYKGFVGLPKSAQWIMFCKTLFFFFFVSKFKRQSWLTKTFFASAYSYTILIVVEWQAIRPGHFFCFNHGLQLGQ